MAAAAQAAATTAPAVAATVPARQGAAHALAEGRVLAQEAAAAAQLSYY